MSCVVRVDGNLEIGEIRFQSGSDGHNNVGTANVDDVSVTSHTMVQVVKVDQDHRLVFCKQGLQLLHHHYIILSVIEGEVADLKSLNWDASEEILDSARHTLSVRLVWSSKYRMVFAIFTPVCFCLR
jgi:flagellar biogenesis protein FliO